MAPAQASKARATSAAPPSESHQALGAGAGAALDERAAPSRPRLADRPAIAAGAGGALETVLDGQTGRLATLDDADSFAQAMREIDLLAFDSTHAQANAERFSVASFQRRLAEQVGEVVSHAAGHHAER